MPIGTSDGQTYKDEFEHAVSTVSSPPITSEEDLSGIPRITVTPKKTVYPPASLDLSTIPPADTRDESKGPAEGTPQGESPKAIWSYDPNEPGGYYRQKFMAAGADIYNQLTGTDQERTVTTPEKIVKGMISGFKLPGDVAEGKVDPMSDEGIGRAFELASAVVLAPAPVVSKIVDGTLGSFAGVKSLGANRPNLDLATKMAEKGMDREQVYEATGWWKGLEGKWRYEIPDSKAQFTDRMVSDAHFVLAKDDAIVKRSLKEVLKHAELYKAYPHLKDVEFQIDNTLNSLGAHHTTPEGKEIISINLKDILEDGRYHPLEVVLHEIQHSIQTAEGFNKGGNPRSALDKAINFLVEKAYSMGNDPKGVREWSRLMNLKNKIAEDPKLSSGRKMSEEIYHRLPGEIEPKAVELRSLAERISGKPIGEAPFHTVEGIADPLPFPGEVAPGTSLSTGSNVTQFRRAANDNKIQPKVRPVAEVINEEFTTSGRQYAAAQKAAEDKIDKEMRMLPVDESFKTSWEWAKLAKTGNIHSGENGFSTAAEYSKKHGQAVVIGADEDRYVFRNGDLVWWSGKKRAEENAEILRDLEKAHEFAKKKQEENKPKPK